MKRFEANIILCLALLIPCASCVYLETSCSLGQTRSEAVSSQGPPVFKDQKCDTVIYASAVSFPEGYDWQKDTAVGMGNGRLLFFKNNILQLEIETGYQQAVSSDADTHHIIDGSLYTEFSTADCTVIRKDGKEILRYQAREYLLGLIERGGDIYTLARDRSSAYMSYRKNGKLLIHVAKALPFGSFQDASYPQTGALYESDGVLCFAYKVDVAGFWSMHLVRDGTDLAVQCRQGVQDIKVVNGEAYVLSSGSGDAFWLGPPQSPVKYGSGYRWDNLRIVSTQKYPTAVQGTCKNSYFEGTMVFSPSDRLSCLFEDNCAYLGGELVCIDKEGMCFCSKNTVSKAGTTVVRACTPEDKDARPFILVGEKKTEYSLNGYFTALEVRLNPSS